MDKANTRCRNEYCRKEYYSCKYCLRTENWRSVACCPECFEAYQEQIARSRGQCKPVNLKPDRMDMTEKQYDELMETPLEEVRDETVKEISGMGYANELNEYSLAGTVDKINADLSAEAENFHGVTDGIVPKRRGRKKKEDEPEIQEKGAI